MLLLAYADTKRDTEEKRKKILSEPIFGRYDLGAVPAVVTALIIIVCLRFLSAVCRH